MSQIYIKEPPTQGKVLLKTTLGDMDIELWSKEAPLACRNFVQLCMEGYYNGVIFHRIVRDFIAQTGDPTGSGEGGESTYGHSFKDEFHSRLKFNRRGLVGMASGGTDDNSSQFFITLNRVDELNKKHTMFGKVTGETLYNMIRLNEIPTDRDDRPLDPAPQIIRTKVLDNPFDDITPRIDPRKMEKKVEKQKSQSKATKNFSLLSFGEEAEGDEELISEASMEMKIKSSHDVLTDDPKLSSELAVVQASLKKDKKGKKKAHKNEHAGGEEGAIGGAAGRNDGASDVEDEDGGSYDSKMRQVVKKKLGREEKTWEEELDEEGAKVALRTKELKSESKKLRKELKEARRRRDEEAEKKMEKEAAVDPNVPEVVRELRREKAAFKKIKKSLLKGKDREEQTTQLLRKFKLQLRASRAGVPEGPSPANEATPTPVLEEEATCSSRLAPSEEKSGAKEDEPGAGNTSSFNWLSGQLQFSAEDRLVLAKDANKQDEDTYDIYDPRNPINKRRREQGMDDHKNEKHKKLKRNQTRS